jgi:hypothetical protein
MMADRVKASLSKHKESPAIDEDRTIEAEESPTDFKHGFRFWVIIIGLGITKLLAALENTVVTTTAPEILSDLQLGENFIWITNAFFICRFVKHPGLNPSFQVPSISARPCNMYKYSST